MKPGTVCKTPGCKSREFYARFSYCKACTLAKQKEYLCNLGPKVQLARRRARYQRQLRKLAEKSNQALWEGRA